MSAPLIIITGPSAAGKTSVAEKLLKKKSLNLKRLITCTTRPKRKGEKNHKDYHFLTEDVFKKAIENKEMLEWSKVYGHYYGSRKTDLKKALQGKQPVLMIVDVQGVKKLRNKIPNCCIIYIDVPKRSIIKRIKKRAFDSEDAKHRIKAYKKEQEAKKKVNNIVVNREGELKQAVKDAALIIKFGIRNQENCK